MFELRTKCCNTTNFLLSKESFFDGEHSGSVWRVLCFDCHDSETNPDRYTEDLLPPRLIACPFCNHDVLRLPPSSSNTSFQCTACDSQWAFSMVLTYFSPRAKYLEGLNDV